jgi:hypothetical protein
MEKIIYNVKKFLSNKNTVTIIGTILVIMIAYLFYNYRINVATSPISIPVAKVTIDQRTKITSDMITFVDVPNTMVGKNVIKNRMFIVGKYANYNVVIPKGSPFYNDKDILVTEIPDNVFSSLKTGQIPYNFRVNLKNTYGNSIFPDSIVDIYMKATDSESRVMIGKFIADVRVLGVKDEYGNDVFESTFEVKVPSTILFGLDKELHLLMRKASYLSRNGVELFAVPRTGTFTTEQKEALVPKIATSYLRDFVIANTVNIEEEFLDEVEQEQPIIEDETPITEETVE